MPDVAPDGSPVEFYRRLPEMGETDLIASSLPFGASILELGCGAGRLTQPLVARGYRLTGVDDSPEMIDAAELREPGASYVIARFDALDLAERFDAALLASHLVNDAVTSRAALSAAARHLAAGGVAIVEAYPEGIDWPGQVDRTSYAGEATLVLVEARVDAGRLEATVRYGLDGRTWDQSFSADLLDEQGLRARLADNGFAFDRWIARERGWFVARPLI